jgi:release factor glutamine methyltransferase
MNIGEAQKTGEQMLRSAGIESLRIDTSILLEKATGKPRSWLFAHGEEELDDSTARTFMDLVARRRNRVPLVHLTNSREFYGLDFFINEHVLTPRMETEKMVEYALTYAPRNSRLLDIGTGSGAIAIAIAVNRPDLEIWASDVTNEALEVARRNARTHGAPITFLRSDLFDNIRGTFDAIVTNLPYLRNDADLMPEVIKEPGVALFGGEDGLALYRRFFQDLAGYLDPGGYVFTECDPWQHEALSVEAKHAGLLPVESSNYFILGFQRQP